MAEETTDQNAQGSAPASGSADVAAGAKVKARAATVMGKVTRATVVVKGPAKGRWRIGRHFTAEPTSIAEADLTPEQKDALANDPELTVTLVDAPH